MTKRSVTESGLAAFYLPIWIGSDSAPPKPTEDAGVERAMREVFVADFKVGVRLRVSHEGYFLFDFSNHPTAKPVEHDQLEVVLVTRARFMNLFLACLQTHLVREKKAAPHLFIDHTTIMSPRQWTLDPLTAATESTNHQTVQEERAHLFFRQTFSVEWIQAAFSATNEASVAAGDRDLLAEMILHAFALHSAGQMESCLVTAWTVAERCLSELWDQYIERQSDGVPTKVNGDRRKKLHGRDFSASVVAEVLSLAGELSQEDYERLSLVRKKRNDWVHKLTTIDSADGAAAIVLAQSMLRAAKLLDLRVPFFPIRTYPLAFVAPQDPSDAAASLSGS
jgi:hypothetical protein